MCTYKKVCITNRTLVEGEFLEQIEKVLKKGIDVLILREKDFSEEAYEILAKEVIALCTSYKTKCMLHTFVKIAYHLNHPFIHLPLKEFLELTADEKKFLKEIGVSTHSVEEAREAEKNGATYITASHIFETACKEGLKPRGLKYLQDVKNAVEIEVYALGGIHPNNMHLCVEAGADGICMMSEYMKI